MGYDNSAKMKFRASPEHEARVEDRRLRESLRQALLRWEKDEGVLIESFCFGEFLRQVTFSPRLANASKNSLR